MTISMQETGGGRGAVDRTRESLGKMPNDALEMLCVKSDSTIRPGNDEGAAATPFDPGDARADAAPKTTKYRDEI